MESKPISIHLDPALASAAWNNFQFGSNNNQKSLFDRIMYGVMGPPTCRDIQDWKEFWGRRVVLSALSVGMIVTPVVIFCLTHPVSDP